MNRAFLLAAVATLAGVTAAQSPDSFGLGGQPTAGQFGQATEERLTVRLVPEYNIVVTDQVFQLAVVINIGEGWAYYSPAPGATNIGSKPLPAGVIVESGAFEQAGETLWPDSAVVYADGAYVYKHRAIAYVPLRARPDAPPGRNALRVRLDGQICKDVCIALRGPNKVEQSSDVSVAPGVSAGPDINPDWTADASLAAGLAAAKSADQLAAARAAAQPAGAARVLSAGDNLTFWGGLGLALLAGVMLNIMPCVLPIIPLRIYSLGKLAGESRRRFATLGLAFATGIVLFFAALAAVNVVMNLALGKAFNWSSQWQIPGVRVALGLLLVVVAANMFGLFTVAVPSRLAGLEGSADRSAARRRGHVASVGMGLMMAVLSTPCSFGILLAALGWAQTQPLWIGTLAFLAMGLGMAAPHAMLAAFPGLVDRLPRPGRWMELFKQATGFILLLVAAWVFSTLGGGKYAFWVVGYAVVAAFAMWMWGSWVRYDAPVLRKLTIRCLAAALAIGAGVNMLRPAAPPAVAWQPFGRQALDAGRPNRIIIVNFTASWCSSCQLIHRWVYENPAVAARLSAGDVLALQADVTDAGSPGQPLLDGGFGAPKAPPLTVVYMPGRPPVLLEGEFGPATLLDLLNDRQ